MSAAVFNALDSNGDGVISRAEFAGATRGASFGVSASVAPMYAAPAPAYSASPFTYGAPTVMPAQTYGAPQAYMSAPTYAAPLQTMTYGASASVGGASVGAVPAAQYTMAPQAVTYAAPPAVTYAAPPVVQSADVFAGLDTNHDGVIDRAEFAGAGSVAFGGTSVAAPTLTYGAPTYGAPAPAYGGAAYSFGAGAASTYTVGPTYGAPQAGYGGGAYTQGKVHQPVLFTQESFLAYQTQGASALPPPEASVIEIAAGAASDAAVKDKALEASADTKAAPANKSSSKKSKKSSKKKKGCC